MNPVWNNGQHRGAGFVPLQGEHEVDAVVIGAGITGLSTALKLIDLGRSVAVLEAHHIGAGSTGRSTGNLYATVSQHLTKVRDKHNQSVVDSVVNARSGAIDWVENTVNRFAIDCQFERRPMYVCVRESDLQQVHNLTDELEVSREAGISAIRAEEIPGLPFEVQTAIKFENQAQFNPQSFVAGLASAVIDLGGRIYENSKVINIDPATSTVATASGSVKAGAIVLATHTPKGINLLQAEMQPYQEYGISAELKQAAYPQGAIWVRDDGMSIRSYEHAGKRYLILVGSKHKTGHGKLGSGYYDLLKDYANAHFDVDGFVHQWSAQQYKPADLLPYIGRSGHQNVFVGTGYAADGLTWAVVAADIISRQIIGEAEIPCADLFNPRRFTPAKSAKNWLKENATVAKSMVQGHFTNAEQDSLKEIPEGEGRVIEVNGEKVAAFRGADNQFSLVSAECPHMKCIVSWNGADTTWDCPCHGSRFTTAGELIEGPAYENLAVRTYTP